MMICHSLFNTMKFSKAPGGSVCFWRVDGSYAFLFEVA